MIQFPSNQLKSLYFFYSLLIMKEINSDAAKQELNLLASLIKGAEKHDPSEQVNIDLFPAPNKKYFNL
jgi:hypothetical protein